MSNLREMFVVTATEEKTPEIRRADYWVHGFWDKRVVRVKQTVDIKTGKMGKPTVEWSCGGRDYDEVEDDILAAECFAKAINDACARARAWEVTPFE